VGRFESTIKVDGTDIPTKVHHAVTIVATGGAEAPTDEYEYGKSPSIMTQEELEKAIVERRLDGSQLGTVVMIQCVGSREPGKREYCSRLCCSAALKNAHKILELNPKSRVIVLYRDMMAYGFKERHYTDERAKGVIFSTYDPENKPKVSIDDEGAPTVIFTDEVLRREIKVQPDVLVLSTGIVPNDTSKLAGILGIERTNDGFYSELDYKWKPVDTLREGVYLCGLAHSPRSIPEALVMAEAAAQQALTVLSHKELSTARLVSKVHESLCTTCELCVGLCPYNARSLDATGSRIVVDELACQGCGICVAGCPSGAASFSSLLERQVMAAIDAQLNGAIAP
jgi:heterodisulfide reductase subunit A